MTHAAKAPVQPGDVLAGKYRVERVLGAGAMGVVVVAMHTQLEQRVAIKFLLQDVLYDERAVQRFAREAKAAARIRSEHVVRVLDVATLEHGEPYMVMEYLEGRDLEALVTEGGPLPLADAVDYVLQALEALCEAHLAGVVHRDLKPSNMFLARRPDGSPIVKLLDFGISKITSVDQQAMTQTQAILGSPLYMAPEQMRTTKSVDLRADIWSMGVVLYQLLTGRMPFMAETMPQLISTVMFDPSPRASAERPDLPPAIDDVIARCLEKEPDRRFQNVGEMTAALAPLAPPHALTSVERIQRMTRPSGAERPARAASQPRVQTASAGSKSDASKGDRSSGGAAAVLAASGPVAEAWQATHGGSRDRRRSRVAVGTAVAAALAIAGVGGAMFFARHGGSPASAVGASAPAAPASIASGSPSTTTATSVPAMDTTVTLAPAAPPAAEAPAASAQPVAPASARGPAHPIPATRHQSGASSAHATTSATPGTPPPPRPAPPASPSGGLSDFGGRH